MNLRSSKLAKLAAHFLRLLSICPLSLDMCLSILKIFSGGSTSLLVAQQGVEQSTERNI
jgi:hypothetical protein